MVNSACEDLMIECINQFQKIDDPIYSESVWFVVDKYVDEAIQEGMGSIFDSDSDTTVSSLLSDLFGIDNREGLDPTIFISEDDLEEEFILPDEVEFKKSEEDGEDYD